MPSLLLAVVLVATVAVEPPEIDDPRILLVEQQLARDHQAALDATRQWLESDPEEAQRLGVDFLRGHLCEVASDREAAFDAFAATLTHAPPLAPWARFRLGEAQLEDGSPEVAAGLLATLLVQDPPRELALPATRLLRQALATGGDCRLLGGLLAKRWKSDVGRQLAVAAADCSATAEEASALLERLLADETRDEVAILAAERLATLPPATKSPRTHRLMGLAFYRHRSFEPAIEHLARTLALGGELSRDDRFELRYSLARSHFWQERFSQAAAAFGALAGEAPGRRAQARALYQRGRSLELADAWPAALEAFAATTRVDPSGSWGDNARLSRIRLHWLRGEEKQALDLFQTLRRRRAARPLSGASLFLASSDLVIGRHDRAAEWLDIAAGLRQADSVVIGYWRGRLAELQTQPSIAVDHYAEVMSRDPYHPLALAARRRLSQPALAPARRAAGRRHLAAGSIGDLWTATLLLDSEARDEATRRLRRRLLADPAIAPWLRLENRPPASWPLWRDDLAQPDELFAALGLWHEGAAAVRRHFPISQPDLAYTGSSLLRRAGATHRSLLIAEILTRRAPRELPRAWLPEGLQRLLYPFPYSYLILSEAGEHQIDPYLLAAIIREESRFDPRAFSGASARGLTQFILPTARAVASDLALGALDSEDLERPETAIALGAAYLGQLYAGASGLIPQAIAGYNAGPPQAALWRRYCFTGEPAEYITKVGFRETNAYVIKVLRSRMHYLELNAPRPEAASAETDDVGTEVP
ncbi:MAG: lytic transglycosylase domain-containing protein [Acidobacteriota bacterium]